MKKVLYALITIIGFGNATMAQVPSYVPTNGLVGYWPFNGNANDASGNGNNGTVTGATLSTDRKGMTNNSYAFSNDAHHIIINGLYQTSITNYTISTWFKKNTGSLNQDGSIVSGASCNSTPVRTGLRAFIGTDNHCFFVAQSQNCVNGVGSGTTQTNYSDGLWHHFTGVFSALPGNIQPSAFTIYIDGVMVAQNKTAQNYNNLPIAPINNQSLPLIFGNGREYDDHFPGAIDDVGIWNRALTQQEITNLYRGCNDSIITAEPTNTNVGVGLNAQFTTASANGSSYQWQTNPLDLGWQNVSNNNSYTGASTNALTINKVSVSNHNQAFRALVNSNGCADTSKVVYLKVADTCLTKVTDTILTTVTDTLIIQTKVGLPTPNIANTLLIYPNPAKDRITIDNGNYTVMSGYSIKIQNSLGQQVFNSAITQAQFNIDLSTWTGKGIYYVRLLDASGNVVTTRKILLQ